MCARVGRFALVRRAYCSWCKHLAHLARTSTSRPSNRSEVDTSTRQEQQGTDKIPLHFIHLLLPLISLHCRAASNSHSIRTPSDSQQCTKQAHSSLPVQYTRCSNTVLCDRELRKRVQRARRRRLQARPTRGYVVRLPAACAPSQRLKRWARWRHG